MGILATFLSLKLRPKVQRKIKAGCHIYKFSQCYQHIQHKKILELPSTTGKQLQICGSGNRDKNKKIKSPPQPEVWIYPKPSSPNSELVQGYPIKEAVFMTMPHVKLCFALLLFSNRSDRHAIPGQPVKIKLSFTMSKGNLQSK